MGVSIIDGTIEERVLKRVRSNLRIFERISFRLADGSTKSIAKAIVDAELEDLLLPGTSGRFYLFTQIDHRGIHGVRTSDGRSRFKFPKNNEKMMLVALGIGLVLIALSVAMGGVSLWGVLLILLGIPGYFLYRATRLAAEHQFAADGGHQGGLTPEPAGT